MYPSRSRATTIAKDTVQILAAGQYTNPAGQTVQIEHLLAEVRHVLTSLIDRDTLANLP
ncbi:MAG TPA: hypothetical protein VG122_13285 [Gemmata sp.]|jgi:hypothetical protein|nr:hypothetical protein [Gemmata sp.]